MPIVTPPPPVAHPPINFAGTSGTGLDQLISLIVNDPGLNQKVSESDILTAVTAADQLNHLIADAIRATGVANDGTITVSDVFDLNAWLRTNYLDLWTTLHGDDEWDSETGFHLVQNDGATTKLFDANAVNTVADGLYHLGFEIVCESKVVNEDGNANASLKNIASWLNSLLATDLAGTTLDNATVNPYVVGTTGTGLDQLVSIVTLDEGLNKKISGSDIRDGATAADQLNHMIVESIRATGVANDGVITVSDVFDLNAWLRADTARLAQWTELHGDDEWDSETGYHLVQNDGATTKLFNANAVDTVADGLYHLGFEICNYQVLNEDGNANASLKNLAYWLNSLLAIDLAGTTLDNADVNPYVVGNTGTGLDQLVSIVTLDEGLNKKISTSDIHDGATAANQLNHLIVDSIRATGVANDGVITVSDVFDLNAWLRANHLEEWTSLHGDDEWDSETGFHLVQDDGATTKLFDLNAVNTVADGLYHLGFEICGYQVLNEDGNANASLKSIATWLNSLLATDLAGDTLDNTAVNPYVVGTTGTGLDQLVSIVTLDEGLNKKISTSDIHDGATTADQLNHLIVESIRATGVANDGIISAADVRTMNGWLRADTARLALWTELHGDDECDSETGFHLVQNDGATTKLFDLNAVNTVADGLYHLGFEICRNKVLNEDGNANASLDSLSTWLNTLLAVDLTTGELNSTVALIGISADAGLGV
jgi:peroxiredoxin